MGNVPPTEPEPGPLSQMAQASRESNDQSSTWRQAMELTGAQFEKRFGSDARSIDISVAVDPVALITTECIAVTSAMRKHARWAHSSVSAILGGGTYSTYGTDPGEKLEVTNGQRDQDSSQRALAGGDVGLANRWGLRGKKGKSMQDNPLISAFTRLRAHLSRCTGMGCSF